MKLVDNAKEWYKMFSIQAQLLASAFLGIYSQLPQRLQDSLPMGVVIGVTIGVLFLGTVGRLVKQNSINGPQ